MNNIPGRNFPYGVYGLGVVEFYAHPNDPRNPNQAGIPYIFESFQRNSPGTTISDAYIGAFLDGRKHTLTFLPTLTLPRC